MNVLADRSSDLAAGKHGGSFLKPNCPDVTTSQSFLQCGAGTATGDPASGEKGPLPRRQVTLVRLGLQGRLAVDPTSGTVHAGWSPAGQGRDLAGRKVAPGTLAEPRNCTHAGGTFSLAGKSEEHAAAGTARLGLGQYYDKVMTGG